MAEIRDELILDISRALREVDELQRALDRALTETEVSLDTTEAQAQARRVQDILDEPITVPLNITGEQALDDLNSDLRVAEGGFDELRREADRAGDEIENVGDQARVAGRQLDDVGTKGGRAFSAVGLGLGALAGGLAAIGAGRLLADFFSDSIQAASDLNESLGKTRIVFGEFSGEIEAFAANAPQAIGLSEQAALEAVSTFGNLFLALGQTQEAAAGMSTDILILATDLASFNNLEVGDVLEKLRSGLVGETEPLRALGVVINDTVIQAKGLELGLSGVNDELTEAEKVQVRYALILEDTETAQGNFALTAEDTANKLKSLKAEFETVLANVGTEILPAFQALIEIAPEFVEALESTVPILLAIAEVLGVLGIGLGDMGGTLSDAEADQRRFALVTGNASDSALLLKGSLFLATREVANFQRESGKTSGGSERLIDTFEAIIGASEATPEALQAVIANLGQLQEQTDLTNPEIEELADLLQNRFVGIQLQSQLQDINTELDNVGTTAGEVATETEGAFDPLIEQFPEVKLGLEDLAGLMEDVRDAFRDEENNIVADFGTFVENLAAEIAATRAFESNLAILEAMGFTNLSDAFRQEGEESAQLLAEAVAGGLTDPTELAAAEALLLSEIGGIMVNAQGEIDNADLIAIIQARLAFDPQAQSDFLRQVNDFGANFRFNVPVTPRLPTTTAPAGGGGITVNVTSSGDAATDGARVAQTVASIIRS